MWTRINNVINNDLFYEKSNYLIKIKTTNEFEVGKTYVGLLISVDSANVAIECFQLNTDLSVSRSTIAYIDISKITSWYLLDCCSKIKYDS